MGVREKINEKPAYAVAAVLTVLVLSGLFMYLHLRDDTAGIVSKMYYSDDDGKTYFADSTSKIFPFDHNGKQACRAWVFQGSGQPFVAYLSAYTPEAKAQLEQLKGKESDPSSAAIISRLQNSAIQVKRPGDVTWVGQNSAEGQKITAVRSPDSSPIRQILP
jgi:hypothetical protein